MVEKDFELEDAYRNGFSVVDLFNTNSLGIQTHRDSLSIDESKNELAIRIKEFFDLSIEEEMLKIKYGLKENKEWKLKSQREGDFNDNKIVRIDYRPFDTRFLYYDRKIVDRLRDNISKHFIQKEIFA